MPIRLTIVVPTRERCDTLRHTLRTIVEQDYRDCEIIVSDNASQDATREVVDSFGDGRIVYVNTGRRLSMSQNWEFALGHVRGDYLTYIGDDDGYLPGAIGKAMALIEQFKSPALVWSKCEYCWPDHIDEAYRNWVRLSCRPVFLRWVDGPGQLRRVISFRAPYPSLPCLYNGIVARDHVDRIRKASTNGVFFNAMSPDVFSGIVLSREVGRYLSTDYPFSVNGASRHSNGTSFVRQPHAVGSEGPYARFKAEQPLEYDERIRLAPSILPCIIGEYVLAQKHVPHLGLAEPSWRTYVRRLIGNAPRSAFPETILASAAHTADRVGLNIRVPKTPPPAPAAVPLRGFGGDGFGFVVPPGMVENIYDACRLISGMVREPATAPITLFNHSTRKLADGMLAEAKFLYQTL